MVRVISYNINGIRAALKKQLDLWIAVAKPDVLCLQEIKAIEGQFDNSVLSDRGYHTYWYSAQKKG